MSMNASEVKVGMRVVRFGEVVIPTDRSGWCRVKWDDDQAWSVMPSQICPVSDVLVPKFKVGDRAMSCDGYKPLTLGLPCIYYSYVNAAEQHCGFIREGEVTLILPAPEPRRPVESALSDLMESCPNLDVKDKS